MKHESVDPDEFAGPDQAGTEGPPWKLLALLVVIVLLAIFFFQNDSRASVSFLWLDLSAPTWVWFFILFLVGVAVGWFGHMIRIRRQAKKAQGA